MQHEQLLALAPVDGRYQRHTHELREYFSEFGLIKHRLVAMSLFLRAIIDEPKIPTPEISEERKRFFDTISWQVTIYDAIAVRAIETKGWGPYKATNHDMQACVLYLRHMLAEIGFPEFVELVHRGRTSEDMSNIAYALILMRCIHETLLPRLTEVEEAIGKFAHEHADLPMLARTHGQPATPTTLGKEFAVFRHRLHSQLAQLADYEISVKLGGASGNFCADHASVPDFNWLSFSYDFVFDLSEHASGSYVLNEITTQIEPHDTYAELFHIVTRINTILIDFCQDIWRYISDDWLVQKAIDGEVGSTAMPNKVNPIDVEQAEKRLKSANSMFEFLARDLPISRLQRDLSDSTAEREFGVAFGHCLIAYAGILRGLGKISPNEAVIRAALNDHPEVLAEAYQTILRTAGYPEGYNALKDLTRGKKVTLEDMYAFVRQLDDTKVSAETKSRMLALTPETYIGLAPDLAKMEF